MSGPDSSSPASSRANKMRLDKWLWHARIARTRTLAAGLVCDGHIRINSQRIVAPGKSVKIGDILTISLDRSVCVLRIAAFGARRGPAAEARTLYETINL